MDFMSLRARKFDETISSCTCRLSNSSASNRILPGEDGRNRGDPKQKSPISVFTMTLRFAIRTCVILEHGTENHSSCSDSRRRVLAPRRNLASAFTQFARNLNRNVSPSNSSTTNGHDKNTVLSVRTGTVAPPMSSTLVSGCNMGTWSACHLPCAPLDSTRIFHRIADDDLYSQSVERQSAFEAARFDGTDARSIHIDSARFGR
jgi:hypothetical protein